MPHSIDLCLKFIKARKDRDAGLTPDEVWPSSDRESRGIRWAACISLPSSLAEPERRKADA
jgi:hypothetical protein